MAPPNYFNHSSSSSPIQLKIKEKPWPISIPPSQPQIPNKTKNFSFKLNTLLAQPNPKSKMPNQTKQRHIKIQSSPLTKQRHLKIQSSPLEKGENNLIVKLPFFFPFVLNSRLHGVTLSCLSLETISSVLTCLPCRRKFH